MNTFKFYINEPFKKTFNTTFMRNIKIEKKNPFFSHKKFLKIFYKPMPLRHLLTFSIIYFFRISKFAIVVNAIL